MSRIRTQPLLFSFFWFWGFFLWSFLVGLVLSPSRRCAWLLALLLLSMHNACVTRHGGRWTRHPPPPIGLLSQLSLRSPRVLGQGRNPVHAPLIMRALIRPGPPTSLRRVTKRDPEREVGEQPYCHTNAVDNGAAQNQLLSFWCALRPYLLDNPVLDFLPPLDVPYPVDPRGTRGRDRESALPHTLLIPEGSRGGAEKCKHSYDAGRH